MANIDSNAQPQGSHVDLDEEGARHWSADELASFVMHPGVGRILMVRTGPKDPSAPEGCLKEAGYQVGRLPVTRESSHLPQAAATFLPDAIYVHVSEPHHYCLDALESLASDPRTQMFPLVALVPAHAPSALIEEAYSRSGCDFFRTGVTDVELLARTHLLVRLARANAEGREIALHEAPSAAAANSPTGGRLDLTDVVTGAHSQMYFLHRLPTEVTRARRYQRPLSVVAVRCSSAGTDDAVASKIAAALKHRVRAVDLVARIEPDLFAVLLPETAVDAASMLASRIGADLSDAHVSAGVGCAGLDEPEGGIHTSLQLLQAAAKRADG